MTPYARPDRAVSRRSVLVSAGLAAAALGGLSACGGGGSEAPARTGSAGSAGPVSAASADSLRVCSDVSSARVSSNSDTFSLSRRLSWCCGDRWSAGQPNINSVSLAKPMSRPATIATMITTKMITTTE